MALPAELQKKVRLLEIHTRKLVNNLFAGEYHSAFRGQGMTFKDFREYVPGDDVRSISWALTARTGRPFVKNYDEEREMTFILAIDVSGSLEFGSRYLAKNEVAAHVAALISFAAMYSKDKVGLLLFSGDVELYIPPKKGHGQVHRILREIYGHRPRYRETRLDRALHYLNGILKKKAHVFIISDFFATDFEKDLKRMGKRHDVVAVRVEDVMELKPVPMGLVQLRDLETGQVVCVDTSSKAFLNSYAREMEKEGESRLQQLSRAQVDVISLRSSEDIVIPLIRFFRMRSGR